MLKIDLAIQKPAHHSGLFLARNSIIELDIMVMCCDYWVAQLCVNDRGWEMIVFGWFVLTGIALWVTAGGLLVLTASLGLSGKIDAEAWVFLIFGGGLLWLSYYNFPFVVVAK